VAWVASLPCAACGIVGYSENAHVGSDGAGMGRRANYDQIAPLCSPRVAYAGCHRLSHERGREWLERLHGVDLIDAAAQAEAAWLAYLAAKVAA
jgi:hypothetical protein